MLIKQTISTEMESLQETVAQMLKDLLEKALNPLEKYMAEIGNILQSLKEQADSHAKKFYTIFNRTDSIQVTLQKNEKDTTSCLKEMTKIQKKLKYLKDRPGRNNVRQVNLLMCVESDDPRNYLQKMLPSWIPSLKSSGNTPVEIDRAHRMFSNWLWSWAS